MQHLHLHEGGGVGWRQKWKSGMNWTKKNYENIFNKKKYLFSFIIDHACSWIGPILFWENIQNTFLSCLGQLKKQIVSLVQTAKYYIIVADCTSSVSRSEQLTLYVGYVSTDKSIFLVLFP